MKQAFTLIELPVVVLIIGILAAIAVPQYQKAVEKSRAAKAWTLLDQIQQAVSVYYLANGTDPTSFDDLDLHLPWTGQEKWRDNSVMRDTRSNGTWSVQLYREKGFGSSVFVGRISGPYAGTGFGMSLSPTSTRKISCVEKTSDGYVYAGNAGSYCKEIFGITSKPTTYPNGRYYNFIQL